MIQERLTLPRHTLLKNLDGHKGNPYMTKKFPFCSIFEIVNEARFGMSFVYDWLNQCSEINEVLLKTTLFSSFPIQWKRDVSHSLFSNMSRQNFLSLIEPDYKNKSDSYAFILVINQNVCPHWNGVLSVENNWNFITERRWFIRTVHISYASIGNFIFSTICPYVQQKYVTPYNIYFPR